MGGTILYLGGNGHAAVRLEAARGALARLAGAPGLVDVPYPGFEGRPRADSLEAFLDAVEASCRAEERAARGAVSGYATGIGALVALALRARGAARHPWIFQGPVLWGLERRAFPRLMRSRLARDMLIRALRLPRLQDRLMGRLFLGAHAHDAAFRARFFDGYARCSAFGDLFGWFTPGWLRDLERRLASRPGASGGITAWIGGRDRVVGRREVDWTEEALGVAWPRVEFPGWGHYPMIDQPEEWADALRDALAAA